MGVAATQRLYYTDSYLTSFRARVVDTSGDGRCVYLDRTALYPSSGGQPHDTGAIAGVAVVDIIDEGDRIAHLTAAAVKTGEVECRVDWPRRFDHMQQHSGQHLLSAVLVELYGIQTVGFHLGADSSAIDVAAALEPRQVLEAERRANEAVWENRAIEVTFEDSAAAADLRKPSDRDGVLRIVSIAGLDRSACGGTHVRATGEIGPILLRRIDRAHGNTRIEFLCGGRAVRRARADYEVAGKIARLFSAAAEDTPSLVAAQIQALDAAEKARRKLAAELARIRGRSRYEATAPGADGYRRLIEQRPKGTLDDELRAEAQGFTSGARALFLAVVEEPPALLAAASQDAGIHAGEAMKMAMARAGGRGGGNAQLAQGSVPTREALTEALRALAQFQ